MSVEAALQVTHQAAAGEDAPSAQVALVCMPFAPVYQPLLGISLLKAILAERDIACDILYLNLGLAERLGLPLYGWIGLTSLRHLLGEWLFARELFGREWDREHPLLAERQHGSGEEVMPAERVELLRQVRNGIGAYLDEYLSTVPWERYKIIGFSSIGEQNVASLALAKRIKAAWPDKVIVFGGSNCGGEMGLELHRRFAFIDVVCRGESDLLFPGLVESLLAGALPPSLPGLILRDEEGESVPIGSCAPPVTELDSLPYPDFDDYCSQLDQSSLADEFDRGLVFESSRGCWHAQKQQCTFCGLNAEVLAFRRKSPERVLDELTYLTSRYGVGQLMATDSILDKRYLRDLIPAIIDRDPGWCIFYEVKANLGKHELQLLKRAGVNELQPGIESLSTSILKLMRKGCTALQNVQLLKWTSEFGIDLYWNYLVGFPGEEIEEYSRMAEMVPALLHLQPPICPTLIRLDRYSPYYDDPEGWGLTNVRAASAYGAVYPFPEESLGRLAYYFDYDHADGRDPRTYTAPLVEEIHYWRDNYCPGALTSVSDGQVLVVHDRRSGATQAQLELAGMEKAAYEYCDKAHTLQAIHRDLLKRGFAVDERVLRCRLEGWVKERLMVRDGDWFLSLAVPADDVAARLSDSGVIRQALPGVIAELGSASSRDCLVRGAVADSPE